MDSYNSQYPLEYYEIGTPYMFYMGSSPKHGSASKMEDIQKYGSALKQTAKLPSEGYCFAKRYVGVVIDKEPGAIHVMFQGNVDGNTVYLTTKYVVNHSGVFCDDKEQFAAGGVVDLTGEIKLDFSGQKFSKGGGIVPDAKPTKGGGVIPDAKIINGGGGVVPDTKG